MTAATDSVFSQHLGRWTVVYTHPHKEQIAVRNLAQQNFTTYCPQVRKTVKHARRVQEVLRPLFPNYLFVQVNRDVQRWRSILSTFGVRNLVRFGDQLSFVEDGFVQCLKERELDGAIVRPERPFAVGQQVRMSGGAFDGLVATIIEMDEKDRLTVLMDLLKQQIKVKTESRKVAAL